MEHFKTDFWLASIAGFKLKNKRERKKNQKRKNLQVWERMKEKTVKKYILKMQFMIGGG